MLYILNRCSECNELQWGKFDNMYLELYNHCWECDKKEFDLKVKKQLEEFELRETNTLAKLQEEELKNTRRMICRKCGHWSNLMCSCPKKIIVRDGLAYAEYNDDQEKECERCKKYYGNLCPDHITIDTYWMDKYKILRQKILSMLSSICMWELTEEKHNIVTEMFEEICDD